MSSETSLLRSPTNSLNQPEKTRVSRKVIYRRDLALTGIPLKQSLVLPDLARTLTEHGRSFPTLRDLAASTSPLINHSTRDVHTLLGEHAGVVFVSVGGDRSMVSARGDG